LASPNNIYYPSSNIHLEVKLYLIHLSRSNDRITHIDEQQSKTSFIINLFNAIDAQDLNKSDLIHSNTVDVNYANYSRVEHYACFLSHAKLINQIGNNDNKYSIIFEDDFNILTDSFDQIIINALNTLELMNYDFDIIYVGNMYNIKGDHLINDIYIAPNYNITMECYIVNNKNAKKIYSLLNYIDEPIDFKLLTLRKLNLLKCLIIYPQIVTQNRELISTIG
jgi:GR25 family glycosyltransferase involved in LPS biosynthesis